ncbi:MAG: hybrid sensor histidine kinase/response regulator, partial [Gammaproteobacteria bacterium]
MAVNYDQVALTWVKDEISNTLEQARQSLEEYFEDSDDQSQIRYCLNCLHQVQGTLLMLEIVGGAMLAEEMENLASEISSSEKTEDDERFEVLMRAILQLPTYLERLQAGQNDNPVVLLPILNELRAQRGLSDMLESQFFSVNLEVAPEHTVKEVELPEDFNISEEAIKLRHQFQKALVGIMKKQNIKGCFRIIKTIFERLESLTAADKMGQFWWVANGFAHVVDEGSDDVTIEVKGLLSRLDRQLKSIVKDGVDAVAAEPPKDLLNKMLYFIAQSESTDEKITQLKTQFNLDELADSASKVAIERVKLAGPDQKVMESVVNVLKEDLTSIKETLDIFVRAKEKDISDIGGILPNLKQIADTLIMLELDSTAKVVKEQIAAINSTIKENGIPTDGLIIDIAGALLFVEASLASKTNMVL